MTKVLSSHYQNINLLSNGAFTRVFSIPRAVEQTNAIFSGLTNPPVDYVLDPLYGAISFSEAIPTKYIGSWDIQGSGSVSLSSQVLSRDGGHALIINKNNGEDISMKQYLLDKLYGDTVSLAISFSGIQLKGAAKIKVSLKNGETEVWATSYSSTAFASYQRVATEIKDITPPDSIEITISGLSGTRLAICGIILCNGGPGAFLPFAPSLEDIYVPSGTIILFDGDECPQGYVDMSTEGHMLNVGAAPYQSVGSDDHDHLTDYGSLQPTARQLRVMRFHQYPSFATIAPYPGESPYIPLGAAHSHTIVNPGAGVPPNKGLKICYKI